jgi:hypothetical protein
MSLRYQSGEKIMKGDRVVFHGEPAQIEFVALDLTGDAEMDAQIQEYGSGVMILKEALERTFIATEEIPGYEDLEFVSRWDEPPAEQAESY